MQPYSIDTADRGRIIYTDKKRIWWLLSLVNPLIPLVGLAGQHYSGSELWLFVPLAFMFVLGPVFDWVFGEDENNPPEVLVPQLEQDVYYRILTYLTVPLHYMTFFAVAIWVGTQNLSVLGFLAITVATGFADGFAINTAHELGHKRTRLESWLARIALAVPAYGHFCIEHNRGHHRDVATPEDPASSRMGENIYQFSLREIPGAFRRAWKIEQERLARKKVSLWGHHNEIIQSYLLSLVMQASLVYAFGWIMLPFLVIHNVLSWWVLTSANYIEHYGLLREKQEDGKYERCQPHHSWNANHKYSNLLLFHLQRHSDHHANPTRRYQSLRHFESLPGLITGYYGMYIVAYLPALWFNIMDKRLLALPHIQGDLGKVNIAPGRYAAIEAKYGQSGV
jgi:alkane 1-monooxygenase